MVIVPFPVPLVGETVNQLVVSVTVQAHAVVTENVVVPAVAATFWFVGVTANFCLAFFYPNRQLTPKTYQLPSFSYRLSIPA